MFVSKARIRPLLALRWLHRFQLHDALFSQFAAAGFRYVNTPTWVPRLLNVYYLMKFPRLVVNKEFAIKKLVYFSLTVGRLQYWISAAIHTNKSPTQTETRTRWGLKLSLPCSLSVLVLLTFSRHTIGFHPWTHLGIALIWMKDEKEKIVGTVRGSFAAIPRQRFPFFSVRDKTQKTFTSFASSPQSNSWLNGAQLYLLIAKNC